jgi:hypothetical protein
MQEGLAMRLFLAGLLLLLGTWTTQAAVRIPVIISPDFSTPARIYPPKVMVSGGHIVLWHAWALNPDCSSMGRVIFHVLKAPEHGTISIISTRVFPSRTTCKGRVSGQEVLYASRAGYTGTDLVLLQSFRPDGRSFLIRIPIIVQ